jgi:CBS domain-containing protein
MTNVWVPPMTAGDVMTKDVIGVGPEWATRAVAKLLIDRNISGVPVVDATGAVIGMVTEKDLIRREVETRTSPRIWWLEMLAEGEDLAPGFLDYLNATDRPVREVMSSPVVTVAKDTPIQTIAELLQKNDIKRVPVLCNGQLVGIVSRADLLRALAQTPERYGAKVQTAP